MKIEGFIPKSGDKSSVGVVARSLNDRCFIYVNNRPIDFPALSKLVTKAYRDHLVTKTNRYPFMFINMHIPPYTYDVNCSPDKRKIIFHDQTQILTIFQNQLAKIYILPDAVKKFEKNDKEYIASQQLRSTQSYSSNPSTSSSSSSIISSFLPSLSSLPFFTPYASQYLIPILPLTSAYFNSLLIQFQ